MHAASFEKFLTDKIKVNGKTGVLGDNIKVAREKTKVTVTADTHLSKRWVVPLLTRFFHVERLMTPSSSANAHAGT